MDTHLDRRLRSISLLTAMAAAGCAGEISAAGGRDAGKRAAPPDDAAAVAAVVPPSGISRLTRHEYDNVLRDLLGETGRLAFAAFPEDMAAPFDNDFRTQRVSGALVEGAEAVAEKAVARLMADPRRRDALVPCTPAGPDDAGCLRRFIEAFGRRALRRPLAEEEVRRYLAFGAFAVEDKSFYTGVATVIRAMLSDPELLYRVETGTEVIGQPGLRRLTGYETATRLSFFIRGTTPDDALLDRAGAGGLETGAEIRAAAAALLGDPLALDQWDRFHALWLGYEQLAISPALAAPMRAESRALVARVAGEDRGYRELLQSDETFIDDVLAQHYGLPSPSSSPGWVKYGSDPRRGLLSQGSFLAAANKFDDTSPTQRGKAIRLRLFCQEIPDPPPAVQADMPPPASGAARCKEDRYAAHRQAPGCRGCHDQMDPIGFGLERYDREGRYREVEPGDTGCGIRGEGEISGVGSFKGPAELALRLIDSGVLERCLPTQLYRFALGRREQAADAVLLDGLVRGFAGAGRRLSFLVSGLVGSEAFRYRRDEE